MEGFKYVDIFATKGVEYLIVIGFLGLLVLFCKALSSSPREGAGALTGAAGRLIPQGWFTLIKGAFYHQGHSWARPEAEGLITVGVDDFAQKLIGKPSAVELPKPGSRLRQGDRGWKLAVESKEIDVLSPVSGEVVSVNEKVVQSPELINRDPYGEGWLLKVKASDAAADLKNLLTGRTARAWMESVVGMLRQRISPELGVVMQDGGAPVVGIAQVLDKEHWDELAREFLLTK